MQHGDYRSQVFAGWEATQDPEEEHVEIDAEGTPHPDEVVSTQGWDGAHDVSNQPCDNNYKVKFVPAVAQVQSYPILAGASLGADQLNK